MPSRHRRRYIVLSLLLCVAAWMLVSSVAAATATLPLQAATSDIATYVDGDDPAENVLGLFAADDNGSPDDAPFLPRLFGLNLPVARAAVPSHDAAAPFSMRRVQPRPPDV